MSERRYVVGGSAKDFEDAYDAMLCWAYWAAYRLLGERTAAEDVAAEALARAYSRWSSVSGHARVEQLSVFFGLSGFAGSAFAGDHDVADAGFVEGVVDSLLAVAAISGDGPRRPPGPLLQPLDRR